MRFRRLFVTFFICIAFSTSSSTAQTESSIAIPSTGADVRDFIPAGWEIAKGHQDLRAEASGDLNNDGRDDSVLVIEELGRENFLDNHILLILEKQTDGRFVLAAHAAFEALSPSLRIEEGTLSIDWPWSGGGRWESDREVKVRKDQSADKYSIIGRNSNAFDRNDNLGEKSSVNYLTGISIVEWYHLGPTANTVIDKAKTTKFAAEPISLQSLSAMSRADEVRLPTSGRKTAQSAH